MGKASIKGDIVKEGNQEIVFLHPYNEEISEESMTESHQDKEWLIYLQHLK